MMLTLLRTKSLSKHELHMKYHQDDVKVNDIFSSIFIVIQYVVQII